MAHERDTEVAACERGHPLHVADRPRVVEAEGRADGRSDLRRNAWIGAELRERIGGREGEDRVHDEADDDDRRYRNEDPPEDVPAHLFDPHPERAPGDAVGLPTAPPFAPHRRATCTSPGCCTSRNPSPWGCCPSRY